MPPVSLLGAGRRRCNSAPERSAGGCKVIPRCSSCRPQHAAHLGLEVTLPEAAGEHLAVVVTVAATDKLDAMLAS
jgi:hypothetical protein